MRKSDFTSRPDLFGLSNYLIREMLALIEHAEQHPQTAAQLSALWSGYNTIVAAALTAAEARTESSGPGGGELPVEGGE